MKTTTPDPLDPTARELEALHRARAPRWSVAPEHPEHSTIQGPVSCADLAVAAALLADYRDREPHADWQLLDGGQLVDLREDLLATMEDHADIFEATPLGSEYWIAARFDLGALALELLARIGSR